MPTTEAQHYDTIIHASWLFSGDSQKPLLENHSLVIKDGKICHILPRPEARKLEAEQSYLLTDQILMPGLINMHGHAAMSLLRGFADDLPLADWLNHHIWPAEQQWVSDEFVRVGTELAIAEMIKNGITCFSDMYFFPNVVAETASAIGIRSQITFPVFDFPSAWGNDADDYIHKGLALRDTFKHQSLTQFAFGPHATYTVNDKAFEKIAMLAEELELNVHTHLHETAQEVNDEISKSGMRPIERLNEIGLLSPKLQCVHMTQVSESDLQLVVDNKCSIVHCPRSNMKLASGISPTSTLQKAGVTLALGTDSAASNNQLSLLQEAESAALLAKVSSSNAEALPAALALQMATANGAKAMGQANRLGQLEPGYDADIIAIDLSQLESQPIHNPISQILYSAAKNAVSHSWVAGKCLMRDNQLTSINTEKLAADVAQWQQKLSTTTQ